jgi:hypothetical protein
MGTFWKKEDNSAYLDAKILVSCGDQKSFMRYFFKDGREPAPFWMV